MDNPRHIGKQELPHLQGSTHSHTTAMVTTALQHHGVTFLRVPSESGAVPQRPPSSVAPRTPRGKHHSAPIKAKHNLYLVREGFLGLLYKICKIHKVLPCVFLLF